MSKPFAVLAVLALCAVCYRLGQIQAEKEIVVKQVEVVRHVQKQKAEIYARPNVGRTVLLELMQNGRF